MINRTLRELIMIKIKPLLNARLIGVSWLLVFLTGLLALLPDKTIASSADKIASVFYIIVCVLLYYLLKPVNQKISLIASLFGLAGCFISLFGLTTIIQIRSLVFFGFHCFLSGYLIFKSAFLPKAIGVLLMFAGVGWLTFISTPLIKVLTPYNMFPGMLGEGAFIVWLLVKGIDVKSWEDLDNKVE